MSKITLQTSDGEMFHVDIEVAKMSNTLKTLMNDFGIEAGDGKIVPVPNVSPDTMDLVIKWCEYHHNLDLTKKKKIEDNEIDDDDEDEDAWKWKNEEMIDKPTFIPKWDREFLDVDQGTIYKLISAANFLDIKDLLDVTTTTVANWMRGKTAEEIRILFNITNNMPEEVEEMQF